MWIRRAGPELVVEPGASDLRYLGFRAMAIPAGQTRQFAAQPGREAGVVLLAGRGRLTLGGAFVGPVGARTSPLAGSPPFVWYVPPNTPWAFTAEGPGVELAVAWAVADDAAPAARLYTPEEIAVEIRGEGVTERRVHHLLEEVGQACHLLLVEVLTPAGHWSSFPPHRHDREDPPREALLEEIYYFRVEPSHGWVLQRVYSDGEAGAAYAVGDGDVVTVPRGYHPVACPPGVQAYYLNAMAGPGRTWNFVVDPAFGHVPGFLRR